MLEVVGCPVAQLSKSYTTAGAKQSDLHDVRDAQRRIVVVGVRVRLK